MEEKINKEYGKLTAEQFKTLISHLPEIRKHPGEIAEMVSSLSKDHLNKLLPEGFAWAEIYELTFIEHLAWLLMALGKTEFLKQAAQTPDPQQTLLDDIQSFDVDFENWKGGDGGFFELQDVLGLLTALQRQILSIMLFQKSISTLVEEAKQGNDACLFDAVRVDRSIVSCPPIADRISKAELLREKHFFIRLRNALKGPSKKHWESYHDLRYALFMLRDLGFDKLSDDQLESLLVHQLKVYPNTYNARKNLRKQYEQSKKINHPKWSFKVDDF